MPVVRRTKAFGDHDTTAGVAEGRAAAMAQGLGYLPGTEISTHYKHREIHVLGPYLGVGFPHHGRQRLPRHEPANGLADQFVPHDLADRRVRVR